VALNLMQRDLVNLRPIRYLDGRWLLIGDIDRGGVFAQLAGTWALLPVVDRARGLGAIINRFRGDIGLFSGPLQWLAPHAPGLDILGTVPFRPDLRPDEEDGLSLPDQDRGEGGTIAWVRLPHAANLTDCQPWWDDQGVRIRWTADPAMLASAHAIVLPGTKNTIGDLRWLRAQGLDQAILAAAKRGALVIGICGGYQMLGGQLLDPEGVAGDAGVETGLGLLPVKTEFTLPKIVRHVTAECEGQRWTAYEIHLGRTAPTSSVEPLQTVWDGGVSRAEGARCGRVWGTYLHGWFESPRVRSLVCAAAGITGHRSHPVLWAEKRQAIYTAMADHLVQHVNLAPVKNYLGI
jgi:adenosylcobyric acid synthase